MTTSEFLRLIENVCDQFDWTLSADTGHHAERRAKPRFHMQAFPKSKPGTILDPIRAAAYARTGNVTDTWIEAAVVLDIGLSDANALAAASSDRTWSGTEGERLPSAHRQQIRRRLLEAVGLIAPDTGLMENTGAEMVRTD